MSLKINIQRHTSTSTSNNVDPLVSGFGHGVLRVEMATLGCSCGSELNRFRFIFWLFTKCLLNIFDSDGELYLIGGFVIGFNIQ